MKPAAPKPTGPHYTIDNCWGWKLDVRLNGLPLEYDAFEANTDEGWVRVYGQHETGVEETPTKKLRGVVGITVVGPWDQ